MGESTSLARQLKKLAAPQTSILSFDKLKPSLLFEPRDAASLDRDTFFAFGCTGLDKLLLIEEKFSAFQQALFSENSKTLERSVQTKDVNKKLDETISDFLRTLSPHFLHRGAHEALEWLIHRFHIHLFNVDDLIACVLPYHHTRIFVRVIQLLDLRNSSGRWYWLKSIQDSGTPLATSEILKQFNSDGGFRKFICDLAPNIMKVYGADKESSLFDVMSFSTLTVYHALQIRESITDSLIAVLLPYIIKGLKSEVSNYCSGTYMIVCAVLVRVKLAPSILEQLMIRVAQCPLQSLQKQSLELILLMFQQQNMKSLPKKAFTSLRSSKDAVIHLKYISEAYRSTRFLQCLLKRAVPSAYKQELLRQSSKPGKSLTFLMNSLNAFSLQKTDVAFCLRLILNWFSKLKKKKRSSDRDVSTLKKVGAALLKCLELRWAEHFDSAVESYFKKKSKKNKCVRTLLNNSVTSLKHGLLPDTSVTLFLGINHPVISIRTHAVGVFLKELSSNEVSDTKFVEDSLIARLNDDCPDVLLPILKSEKVLLDFLAKEQLFIALNSILLKSLDQKSEDWHPVKLEALKIMCNLWELCSETETMRTSIFSVLLPFLLPLRCESVEYLSCILDSSLGSKHPIISALKGACFPSLRKARDDGQKLMDVSCKIIKSLVSAVESMEGSTKYEMVFSLLEQQSNAKLGCSYSFIIAFVLQHLVCTESDVSQQIKWTRHVLDLFSSHLDSDKVLFSQESIPTDVNAVVMTSLKVLRKKKFPVSAMSFVLQEVIKSLKLKYFSEELMWWPDTATDSESSSSFAILFDLFQFLIKYMNSTVQNNSVFKTIFGTMIQTHFVDLNKMFWFLASLWCGYAKPTLAMQIAAIKIAEALCTPPPSESLNWVYGKSCVVLPSLLVIVGAPNQQVRYMALELLQKILLCQHGSEPLQSFSKNICSHSKEIGMDSNQVFQIVGHWLSPAVQHLSSSSHGTSDENHVLQWLMHLIVEENTPKVIKLNTLSMLRSANSKEMLSTFLPVLKQYLVQYKDKEVDALEVAIIQHLLNKFTVETADLLKNEKCEAFVVLSMALQLIVQKDNSVDMIVHEIALNQVTKEFFMAIPSAAVQQKILGMLVDLYLTSVSADVTSKIGKTLRKLCVYASQILKELHDLEFASPMKTVKEMRRSRTQQLSAPSDTDFLENGPWKKIVVILEIIQGKKKINQKEILVPELFNILSKTLEWENQPSVEYVRQLVLSSIFNCCDQLGIGGLDETQFQVELVVQCIRISDNPKTHRQSLLLLNLAATMFPDHVLNNIMSIFTFMGSSIVRQDDSYSFQVIEQTIETIVPALLQASHQQTENDSLQVIATVIRVFVDSLLHIPRHRQLQLFLKLITTLGPSDYLWLPLAQICESFVTREVSAASVRKGLADIENNPLLEFSLNLYELFAPSIQINSCTNLISFLTTLPERKDEKDQNYRSDAESVPRKEPFDVEVHSELQLRLYKFTVLHVVNTLLASQSFIGQVSVLEAKHDHKMEEQYKSLIEVTLKYLKHAAWADSSTANDDLSKATTSLLYDLLNNVIALLPCDQFISVMLGLLKNKTAVEHRKILEILNAKLENQPSFFSADKYGQLLKLLKPLLRILQKNVSSEDNSETEKVSEDVQSRQNALLSVHLICKIIGSEYPSKFQKVLLIVVEILSSDSSQYPLIVNALLCLAQLCKCLKAHVLPQLNIFMPKIVHLLEESHAIESNDCLALGVVTALQGLIEYLGVFLSGFIGPIVTHVCELATKFTGEKGKKANLQLKLQKLLELIAAEIPVRVLVPAIRHSYGQIMQKNKGAVSSLMFILRERISTINLSDLQAHCSEMEEFYILALDFRTENPLEPLPVIEAVEESVIAAVTRLVLKLSETAFGAFFRSIFRWAIASAEHKDRVLTFYRLTHELSVKLKNLFVQFAGVFVRHAAPLLDANNASKTEKSYFGSDLVSTVKSKQLLNYVLDTFTNCFIHDNKELVDKDCFNILMQPLVDQIENEQGGDEAYKERIEKHLTSCIAHFAISVTDSSLCKPLNYQILLKTRHSSPKVRFSALLVIGEVVRKMDNEYLTLVAESVPFLAELMEDDSFEVEQQCQTVVAEMEQILGEPLSKYF